MLRRLMRTYVERLREGAFQFKSDVKQTICGGVARFRFRAPNCAATRVNKNRDRIDLSIITTRH